MNQAQMTSRFALQLMHIVLEAVAAQTALIISLL